MAITNHFINLHYKNIHFRWSFTNLTKLRYIRLIAHGCTLAGLKLNHFLLTWFVIINKDFVKRLFGLFLITKLLYTYVTKPFWNFLFCIQGALSFAYTVLPCAGGTDLRRSQLENQVHVDMLIQTCNTNMSIKYV